MTTTNQKIPSGYKQTEIGVIPVDWDIEQIKGFATIKTGSKNTQDRIADGLYPFFVRSQKVERINSYSFDGEAVLTAGDGVGTGKVFHYINGKFDIHQRVYKISEYSKRVDGYFFFLYFSNNFFSRIMQMTAKSSVDSVRMEMIAEMQVPIPSKPEQSAIATALSDADLLIAKLEKLLEKKKNIKQGAMQELLTGKRRLPGFSGEWDIKTIEELEKTGDIKLSRGKVISKKDIEEFKGIFPIYSSSIHNNGEFGRYGLYMFDEELITWSVDGGGNFFYRNQHKFSVTNVCGYMRVNAERLSYQFLAYQLQFLHSKLFFDYTMKAHPSVIRKAYSVKIPKLAEQDATATILSDMDAEIIQIESQLTKYQNLKQGMMRVLLTGKIRLI